MILHSHLAPFSLVRQAAVILALFLAAPTAGLAQGAVSPPLRVVVSLNPYHDLVERVAGDRATVSTILPAGASPHAFDPSPSQAAQIARADLIVMNGGLDLWLNRLIEAAAAGTPVLVVMDAIEFEPHEGHAHGEHDHGNGEHEHGEDEHHDGDHDEADHALTANPHIWLDPVLMEQAADQIAAALAAVDPASADTYRANAQRLKAELHQLDDQLSQLLAPAAGAPFVPFHDAWVYFAERYGLNIVVTLEPFPGREPSPRYVAEAVQAVIASGASVIFAERQLGSRSAEVVAESAGVTVGLLDPIGGAPGPTTYDALLLENAAIIVEALGR